MFGSLIGKSVPAVDHRYWTLIILASIAGCNLGDCCSYYFGWNHWIGLVPLAILFLAVLGLQSKFANKTEVWYWSLVLILRAAATNLADLLTHTYDLKYTRVLLGLGLVQMVAIWLSPAFSVSADGAPKPIVNRWYWLCLLAAGTLGTAVGDWTADEAGLGTGLGTLFLGMPVLVMLILRRRLPSDSALGYWLPIIAIRAAGTTAGDWIAFHEKPGLLSGAGIGLAGSTVLTVLVFIMPLLFWKRDARFETA